MKVLIDAQLPRRLVYRFREAGFDCVHTFDLPDRNRTTDEVVIALADQDERIVVTKDADFVNTFMLYRQPKRLLLVSTGNISNNELEQLMLTNIGKIIEAFSTSSFVEITRSTLIVHF